MSYPGLGAPPSYTNAQTQKTAQPLGVEPNYQAPVPPDIADAYGDAGFDLYQVPRYYAGAQWGGIPGFPTDPQGVTELQMLLIRAGYLNPKAVIVGQWEGTSATAFAQLLGAANQAGVDWQTALARSLSTADQTAALSASTKQNPPLTISLSNPDDIKAVLHNTAMQLYGGDLNDEQTQQFINSIQEKERAAQTQQYHQQYGAPGEYGPGGETVSSPSGAGVGYEAEQAIRQAHPGQVFASYMGQNLQKLMPGLLGEGAGLI